jgi:hypothetical protein
LARFRDWFGEWTVFIAAGIALLVIAWQSGFLRLVWVALAALPVPVALLLVAVIAGMPI